MGEEVQHLTGGIAGLRKFIAEHKGAINYELQTRLGYTLWDAGRTHGWRDLKDFVEQLPLNGDSALFRSCNPRSWWVTPEIKQIAAVQYVLELANWQRAGGKKVGAQPKPPKFPEDNAVRQISSEELKEKRRSQREHLTRVRASGGRRRKSVERINPG